MSAYVVDRNHIRYLLRAMTSKSICPHGFRWVKDNDWEEIRDASYSAKLVAVGQTLWDENVTSVTHRYPDCQDDPARLPGPIDEQYTITEEDIKLFGRPIDPVQVIKACHCYRYQSCEHEEWETSEAKAIIDSLIDSCTHALPGYEEAEWGAPVERII